MPICMRRSFRLALLVGELGRKSVAVYYGRAVRGKDHVRHVGQRLKKIYAVAC